MNDDQLFVFAMTMLICATCVAFAIVAAFARRRKAPPPPSIPERVITPH